MEAVCVYSVKYNSLFIMRANICMFLLQFLLHFSYLLPWQLCTVPLQSDYVLTNPSYEYESNLFLVSYCVQMSWKNHFFIDNVYLCIWQTHPKLLTVHLMYILSVFVFPVIQLREGNKSLHMTFWQHVASVQEITTCKQCYISVVSVLA